MTALDDEYASALERIQSAPRGPEVLAVLPALADSFAAMVSQAAPSFGLVFQLFGRQGIVDIIHKNFVLIFGRLLLRARAFDGGSLQERIEPLVSFLYTAASHAKQWAVRHEEAVHPLHDKKERLKRRHTLVHEEQTHASQAAEALLKVLWYKAIPILFPEGAASLYLPAGGSLLLSTIDKELSSPSFLPASPDQSEKISRSLKTAFLYWALDSARQNIGKGAVPRYDVAPELLNTIESLLPSLREAFLTFDLPKEDSLSPSAAAEPLARSLLFLVQSFPLESVLTSTLLAFSGSPETLFHTEGELDALIDQLGRDDRPARAVLQLITPAVDLGLAEGKALSMSFWGMLMQGLTSTVTDAVVEDALASFDWEGAQKTVLARLRWFLFSPYADEAVVAWTQQP